jgi:hypothetical protein
LKEQQRDDEQNKKLFHGPKLRKKQMFFYDLRQVLEAINLALCLIF